MQAQGIVQLTKQEQTAIGADLGTVKFQPHASIKTQPKTALRTRTYRVIQNRSLQSQITH